MSISAKIMEDLKQAMKNKDKVALEALRSIKTALHLAKTEKAQDETLTDEEELRVVQKLSKQRKDAAEIYKSQGREDLYQNEMQEAEVIAAYLPKPLTDEELNSALQSIIEKLGASGPQDMGKVMGAASKELGGKAEGKVIAAKVKGLLGK